ncbi:MAG TPA: hypothetical protein ENL37_06750 [Desulfobacteraceae bacterium]|uniref:hypothetical protein n=1 Tax=Hydrogenimonas sp. TaxID=2231112 RepID=UPI00176EF0E9|nr:hypothetical protein [Hydrogenimonas sp.]HHE74769.1 hypothetical protein [Desulfobacteraceae bacterium]
MKCSIIECKNLAKKVHTMRLSEIERELTKCNRCFFSLNPSDRYSKKSQAYKTRNEVGAAYALAYFKK